VRRDVALGLRSSAPCRIVGAFRPETGRRTGVVLYCTNSEGSVNLPVKKTIRSRGSNTLTTWTDGTGGVELTSVHLLSKRSSTGWSHAPSWVSKWAAPPSFDCLRHAGSLSGPLRPRDLCLPLLTTNQRPCHRRPQRPLGSTWRTSGNHGDDGERTPGVTVLAGQNATNRTSFLQAIMAAMGSDRVTLKGSAEEGRVSFEFRGETYERTLTRADGSLRVTGEGYLEDPGVAELFAFLLETNEARRAVALDGDLRDIIMRPVDVDAIVADIEELEARKGRSRTNSRPSRTASATSRTSNGGGEGSGSRSTRSASASRRSSRRSTSRAATSRRAGASARTSRTRSTNYRRPGRTSRRFVGASRTRTRASAPCSGNAGSSRPNSRTCATNRSRTRTNSRTNLTDCGGAARRSTAKSPSSRAWWSTTNSDSRTAATNSSAPRKRGR